MVGLRCAEAACGAVVGDVSAADGGRVVGVEWGGR